MVLRTISFKKSGVNKMYFKDSFITDLTPFSAHEESTAIPLNIFPAYVGSGNTVMSIDASGLQGLNHGVQSAFGCMPDSGDMYLVSHGMMGNQISEMNVLPYGYLTWDMNIEDTYINEGNLNKIVSTWSRNVFIDEGKVNTKMLLGYHASLELSVTIPLHRNCVIIQVNILGYDYENKPVIPPKKGKMGIWLNMNTRKGMKTFDKAILHDNCLSVDVAGHEQYKYRINFSNGLNKLAVFKNGRLGIEFDFEAGNKHNSFTFIYSFNEEVMVENLPRIYHENVAERKKYFDRIAKFEGIGVKEEFLYNNSHYLLMSCFDLDKGLPIGMPFYFPWCWRCSTFWDSHFVLDGLMRSCAKPEADKFLKFIFSHLRKTGKPFPWMFAYDGTSTVENDRDIAPLVMCAHAMTAIKHFEYFDDVEMLSKYGYEICRRVSEFAANNLFSKDFDGKWILSLPVSNDVVDEVPDEINQTFTALWFLVIFKKTTQYSKMLGLNDDALLLEIISNYKLEKDENEYFHSKGKKAEDFRWASWVPFLMYPTEGEPFIDSDLFCKTREKYTYPKLYMDKQGSYQPWTEFMEASSDYRRGAVKEGYELRKLGISHTFGLGYFSEIGPRQQTVGLPPYISAHGTFLTSLIFQFVTTSIWNDKIGIFTSMPNEYLANSISVKNVVCRGNIKISALLTTDKLEAQVIGGDGREVEIALALPVNADENSYELIMNGILTKASYMRDRNIFIKINCSGLNTLILKKGVI
jgi:hypothetical protein